MKLAILTLDFINDICDLQGKIAYSSKRVKANRVIDHANQVLTWGREQRHLIAHVKVGFRASYVTCSTISPLFNAVKKKKALLLGSWGTEFCQALSIEKNEPVVIKHRVSAFYATELETLLRSHRIEHVVLLGVSTNNVVELTAREAHDRDYRVTVVADACEAESDEIHQASVNFLKKIACVVTAEELIK